MKYDSIFKYYNILIKTIVYIFLHHTRHDDASATHFLVKIFKNKTTICLIKIRLIPDLILIQLQIKWRNKRIKLRITMETYRNSKNSKITLVKDLMMEKEIESSIHGMNKLTNRLLKRAWKTCRLNYKAAHRNLHLVIIESR